MDVTSSDDAVYEYDDGDDDGDGDGYYDDDDGGDGECNECYGWICVISMVIMMMTTMVVMHI